MSGQIRLMRVPLIFGEGFMRSLFAAVFILSLGCAKDAPPAPSSADKSEAGAKPDVRPPAPPIPPAPPSPPRNVQETVAAALPDKSREMFEKLLPLIPLMDRTKARAMARQVQPSALPATVVLAVPNKLDPYFAAYIAGFEEAAREVKLSASVRADENYDALLLNQLGLCDVLVTDAPSPSIDSQAMKSAVKEGLVLISWQFDPENPRSFVVRPATDEAQAQALVDALAVKLPLKGVGKIGLLSVIRGGLSGAVLDYAKKTYPQMRFLETIEDLRDPQTAMHAVRTALAKQGNLDGLVCLDPVVMTGALEAVSAVGQTGKIRIVAIASPKEMKAKIEDGALAAVVYWNPKDLGYLATHTAAAALGGINRNLTSLEAGRLGKIAFNKGEAILGKLETFTKDNISKAEY